MSDLTPGSSEWHPVPGYPSYLASRDGRVKGPRGRVLSPAANARGYLKVQLGFANSQYVHRVVATTYIGETAGMEVEHLDGDPANNAVTNLRIVTHAENMRLGVVRRQVERVATRG